MRRVVGRDQCLLAKSVQDLFSKLDSGLSSVKRSLLQVPDFNANLTIDRELARSSRSGAGELAAAFRPLWQA